MELNKDKKARRLNRRINEINVMLKTISTAGSDAVDKRQFMTFVLEILIDLILLQLAMYADSKKGIKL